ncbi:MAG: GAF domain-containing protein [Chloroflexota bacterium]|nr:GAF domain-containing protein [Chloroflexota bacterium]
MDNVNQERRSDQNELARDQATITRQAEEIAHLRRQLSDERFAQELRAALTAAVTAGMVSAPVTTHRLLELIVQTAAQVLSAQAASLFLLDEQTQELVFEVALGEKAAEVAPFRVPLGHGVAGLVALTGQAMAVSDAVNDPRQASDIAEKIGYQPQSLLCVPLFESDSIIGVLELLDKASGASFTPVDMDLLGHFANLAGVAIAQSRVQSLVTLLEQLVQSLGASQEQQATLLHGSREFAVHLREDDRSYDQTLALARLVHSIASHGDAASEAVQTILRGFAEYLESQAQTTEFGDGR